MTDQVSTTAQAFFDELDQLRRHADDLQNQLVLAHDQLRTAGIEAEKSANRIDLLIEANTQLQHRADRQQGRADRAYIKLETLGRIMINGIEDVLNDAKQDAPALRTPKLSPEALAALEKEWENNGGNGAIIPSGPPIPPEQKGLLTEKDILAAFHKPEPGAAAQYLRENAPRFGSGPRRSHPHDHGQD